MTSVKVPGKDTVHVGDLVDVAGHEPRHYRKFLGTIRGWSRAKVLGFIVTDDGRTLARVTRPKQACGTTLVPVEAVTRKRGQ